MGADLAVRVASHFQLRNALSMENKQLRGQIASLQQAKLIKDGMLGLFALFQIITSIVRENLS
jgi:hypothetical protein